MNISGRVGGGIPGTVENAPHACLLLVSRADLEADGVAFGSGSIISQNRVITAAHVVRR